MKSSKYKKPEEFFKYLIEEFGYSIFNDQQKCLAIASDMFEGDKQVTFLIKTAFSNNVFIELLKARNSSTENKHICIQRAIKILTDDCCIASQKASDVVGLLASIIYPNEWNSFLKQSISQNDNKEENNLGSNKTGKTNFDKPIQQTPKITSENINSSTNKTKVLDGKNWTLEDINLEMIYCPAGSFMMGSPIYELGRYSDEIQHKVIISKPFFIGRYPIFQKQYKTIMGNNPSKFKEYNNPVESINWNEAISFCDKLNMLYKANIPQGYYFTLPTEAQWEYACRAGTNTPYNNNKPLSSKEAYSYNLYIVGWHSDYSRNLTHPVGLKKANNWGIFDMHGNVWEWCIDNYIDYPNYTVTDPIGISSNTGRVIRGGSFTNNQFCCRSSHRGSYNPNDYRDNIGFRVALVPIE